MFGVEHPGEVVHHRHIHKPLSLVYHIQDGHEVVAAALGGKRWWRALVRTRERDIGLIPQRSTIMFLLNFVYMFVLTYWYCNCVYSMCISKYACMFLHVHAYSLRDRC